LVVFDINSRNIYHRDLKPANFLIKRDKNGKIYLHLNDFGTAKSSIVDKNRIVTSVDAKTGTVAYMAPEILNALIKNPDITKQDVWAIGIIAYQISTFSLPFSGDAGALMNAIINIPH
jgi:serine/threonine protein kinase